MNTNKNSAENNSEKPFYILTQVIVINFNS